MLDILPSKKSILKILIASLENQTLSFHFSIFHSEIISFYKLLNIFSSKCFISKNYMFLLFFTCLLISDTRWYH